MAKPAIWLPTIRAGTGADTFTTRLVNALTNRGVQAKITWLPHRVEFAPWSIRPPKAPDWANVVHINSRLHTRFVPAHLRVVTTVHSFVHDPALSPYKSIAQSLYHRLWIRRQEAQAIHRATVVTAVSRYAAEQALSLFGRQNIVSIPNWVDIDLFSLDARRQTHRPFRLLFAGGAKRLKGADLLPEIMQRLGPEFVLYFTGTQQEIARFGPLPANMVALGRQNGDSAMAAAYRECDALLFPTRLEGFGLVALEAQACGRPVIASNCSALPEVVLDEQTGLLCPVDDIEAFVRAARRLRDEPMLWQRMGAAGRAHVERNFTEDLAIQRYIEVYTQCLANP